VLNHKAICVPNLAPRLLGRFARNSVDFDAVQAQNPEGHKTPWSRKRWAQQRLSVGEACATMTGKASEESR